MSPGGPLGDVVLQPGGFCFGRAPGRVRTLLGSCVAITMWHPGLLVGGMCHYLLPSRSAGAPSSGSELDGRYGDEAWRLFVRAARRHGTGPGDYQFKIFGGGEMFDGGSTGTPGIGERNVVAGFALLAGNGLVAAARHTGGDGSRVIVFDLGTGEVLMRHAEGHVNSQWMAGAGR